MDCTVATVSPVTEDRLSLYYKKVKLMLHVALPENLECREKETDAVICFLKDHILHKQSGSLYVYGAPGSGKTAVVTKAVESLKSNRNCQIIYINCMSLRNSLAIFNNILSSLGKTESTMSSKETCCLIEEYITSSQSIVVLVLDELDSLDSRDQAALYTVFEWPTIPQSSLIVIGIANSLDLTDRALPRLQARPNYQPKLLMFSSYNREEIMKILRERLSKVGGEKIFESSVIQFCAGKVVSLSGDIRMALDICRRAIEIVEAAVKLPQHISANGNSDRNLDFNIKKVGIPQIQRIISQVYGSKLKANESGDPLLNIPVQQELIISALLLMLRDTKYKDISFGKFHEKYCDLCQKNGIKVIDQSEFYSACSLIEARGIIRMRKARDTRNTKVSLNVDEKELESIFRQKTLMSSVLQNCL